MENNIIVETHESYMGTLYCSDIQRAIKKAVEKTASKVTGEIISISHSVERRDSYFYVTVVLVHK